MLLVTVQPLASYVHAFYNSCDAPYRLCTILLFWNRSLLFLRYLLYLHKLTASNNTQVLAAGYFRTAHKINTQVSVGKFLRLRGRKWVLIFIIKVEIFPVWVCFYQRFLGGEINKYQCWDIHRKILLWPQWNCCRPSLAGYDAVLVMSRRRAFISE